MTTAKTLTTQDLAQMSKRSISAILKLIKAGDIKATQTRKDNGRMSYSIPYDTLEEIRDKVHELIPRGGYHQKSKGSRNGHHKMAKGKARMIIKKPAILSTESLSLMLEFRKLGTEKMAALLKLGQHKLETILLLIDLTEE